MINILMVLIIFGLMTYYKIFSGFFFMDDFYFLQISQAKSLKGFINFFKPIRFIPYRPVSQQLFFFPMQKVFGINPVPFHIFVFFIHVFNSWIVYKISLKFLKNSLKAKLISLMYVVSCLHFVGLFSITGSYVLFGVFYFLLSLWLWLQFEESKKNSFYISSLFAFILGIFSSEIAASLPLIIVLISKLKNKLKKLLPYGLVILINLFVNFSFAGAPNTKAFAFKLTAFPSLFKWYMLRILGLPEGVRNGDSHEKIIIYSLFLTLLLIIIISIFIQRKIIRKNLKLLAKYFLWIIIAALPFYFMPYHLNPVYFSISLLGFLLLVEKVLLPKLFFIYSCIFIIMSFFSVKLLMHTHWTVKRSGLAKEWIEKTKKANPDFSKRKIIVFTASDEDEKNELEITLQGNRAMQLFYNQEDLRTVYKIGN